MAKRTFSSGTEYECFLDTYCNTCRRHIDYESSFDANVDDDESRASMCPIELMLELARFNEEDFPNNFVTPDKKCHFSCSAWEKGTHPMMAKEDRVPELWRFKREEPHEQPNTGTDTGSN